MSDRVCIASVLRLYCVEAEAEGATQIASHMELIAPRLVSFGRWPPTRRCSRSCLNSSGPSLISGRPAARASSQRGAFPQVASVAVKEYACVLSCHFFNHIERIICRIIVHNDDLGNRGLAQKLLNDSRDRHGLIKKRNDDTNERLNIFSGCICCMVEKPITIRKKQAPVTQCLFFVLKRFINLQHRLWRPALP